MGATLIVNPGSSSKKFALYKDGVPVMSWHFEQTGSGFQVSCEFARKKEMSREVSALTYQKAVATVVANAMAEGLIGSASEIATVGIRIVAPATYFTTHREIDNEYVKKLAALSPLAPNHTPHMVAEIKELRHTLPTARLIGISDSAFHTTSDPTWHAYSLSREDKERFDIHSFGYHGLSVASIVTHIKAKEGSVPERLVVCHVGSGVSVTAVRDGVSIATSMGFTPVSGVMMSSRMGDLPADILAALMIRKGLKKDELMDYLGHHGGFMGMTGVKDLRLVLDLAARGEEDAQLALDSFARQIKNYIAQYAMLMDGVDMIVLTATAAERNPAVRRLLVGELPLLHTYVHEDRNDSLMHNEGYFHTDDSHTKLLTLKTDEMGEMYRVVNAM